MLCLIITLALGFGNMTSYAKDNSNDNNPFSRKRVYVFYPGKSLNLETDIYAEGQMAGNTSVKLLFNKQPPEIVMGY